MTLEEAVEILNRHNHYASAPWRIAVRDSVLDIRAVVGTLIDSQPDAIIRNEYEAIAIAEALRRDECRAKMKQAAGNAFSTSLSARIPKPLLTGGGLPYKTDICALPYASLRPHPAIGPQTALRLSPLRQPRLISSGICAARQRPNSMPLPNAAGTAAWR